MSTALWIVLSLVLAEIGYTIAYIITGVLIRTIFVGVSFVIRRHVLLRFQPAIIGLFAGCGGIIIALVILFLIRKHVELTANWYLIVSVTIIFYGQVQYMGKNLKAVPAGVTSRLGWPGRFNFVASAPMERAQFEYYLEILRQRHPDQVKAEGDPLGHEAYKMANEYMLSVSIASLLGILAGLPLYYWLVYK